MRRLLAAVVLPVVLAVVLASLTACGGGDTAKTTSNKAGSSTSPTTSATKVADSPAPTKAADGKGLCAFLKSETPRMEAAGSVPGALADLAIELANWIDKHPDQKPDDSAAIDEMTKRDCPDVRKAALKPLKADSFQGTL